MLEAHLQKAAEALDTTRGVNAFAQDPDQQEVVSLLAAASTVLGPLKASDIARFTAAVRPSMSENEAAISAYPHTCACGSPCYIGMLKVECTNADCTHSGR